MSKADTLLKKAAFFERLALYSDRKSYLKALAQAAPEDQENRRLAQQALSILQQLGIDDSKTTALGNAVIFGKVDLPAIRREIQDATLTGGISPLSHQAEINQLRQISSSFKAPATDNVITIPEVSINSSSPSAGVHRFPPINKADQQAVFQFAIEEGELFPDPQKQQADGKLGPETRKALEGVKNYFAKTYPQSYDPKQGGVRMTDQQAIQAAKTPPPPLNR